MLGACGMLPTDKADLLQSRPRSERYCYPEQQSEIAKRIRTYLSSCYRPTQGVTSALVGGTFIPVTTSVHWQLEEDNLPTGSRFTVNSTYGYVLGAEVTGAEQSCSSILQVFAGNQMWMDRFETLDRVARKETVKCPY